MMPSKYRGRVDIWINGTYWAGAIIGSFASLIFLNAFAENVGWRLALLMGPVLALVVLVVGRTLPESPRWLMTHGRVEEAERELGKIEDAARKAVQYLTPVDDNQAISLIPEKRYGYLVFLGLVLSQYPKRAILGASLMIHSVLPPRDQLDLHGPRRVGPPQHPVRRHVPAAGVHRHHHVVDGKAVV
jgi:MFS family permease